MSYEGIYRIIAIVLYQSFYHAFLLLRGGNEEMSCVSYIKTV